jgi:hexosaminidase
MKSQQNQLTGYDVPSLIPQPVEIEVNSGHFIFNEDTVIHTDIELEKISLYLKELITTPTGFNTQIEVGKSQPSQKNVIRLTINKNLNLGNEGYRLITTQEAVHISAPKPAGLFYGIQTLRQLLPVEIEKRTVVSDNKWVIPNVKIEDYPRFTWRGFMLDEGRHFHGKNIVKKLLDIMALHKMNIFHWHLTEDQGWRIEIKNYPRLTEVGSKRKGTQINGVGKYFRKKIDYTTHKGYYTQKDIEEIIIFAKNRFINVIPEFDIPGHSMAALAAYPQYSCSGGPFEVQTLFGIKEDVFCPGKEDTTKFITDILDEFVDLFPSKIVHIGGDEVPKIRWENCSDCQARIKTEGLKDENELETQFINSITSYLLQKDITPIVWNDIIHDDLALDVIGQHWLRGDNLVLSHLRKGRKFIRSGYFYTYLDYPYTMTPLRKAYSFEPIPEDLEEEHHENVLGIETPMWTEWAPTPERLYWQIFPRFSAHAETGWTLVTNKNYSTFRKRLKPILKRLTILGVQSAQLNETDPNFIKRVFNFRTIVNGIIKVSLYLKP